MRRWVLRILALTATSLGVSLLVAPFPTSYTRDTGQVFVQFDPRPPVDAAAAAREHGAPVCTVAAGVLARHPDVADVLTFLDSGHREAFYDRSAPEWVAFESDVCGGASEIQLIAFDNSLLLARPRDPDADPGPSEFRYLGDLAGKALPILTAGDLARLPNSEFALERTTDDPPGIPFEAWEERAPDLFGEGDSARPFSFNGQPYAPRFELVGDEEEVRIPGLKVGLWGAGVLLLLLGIYCFRNLYPAARGVAVNPRWVAMLWDGIVLAFALLAAFLTADALLTHLSPVPSLVNDEFGTAMGVFFFVLGIPMVAAYTTSLTSQSISTDDAGIRIDGMSGLQCVGWQDLAEIGLSDDYIVVRRAGIPLRRKLQRRLRLKSRSGAEVFVNEPQVKSAKNSVREELLKSAPPEWATEIRERLAKW